MHGMSSHWEVAGGVEVVELSSPRGALVLASPAAWGLALVLGSALGPMEPVIGPMGRMLLLSISPSERAGGADAGKERGQKSYECGSSQEPPAGPDPIATPVPGAAASSTRNLSILTQNLPSSAKTP